MSADLLRRAAAVLRERAEAATPAPWLTSTVTPHVVDTGGPWGAESNNPFMVCHGDGDVPLTETATYIATMHPGVGVALAEWLLIEAHHVASHECAAQCPPDGCDEVHAALAVARLIVGES